MTFSVAATTRLGDLVAHGLDRALPLGLDLLARGLDVIRLASSSAFCLSSCRSCSPDLVAASITDCAVLRASFSLRLGFLEPRFGFGARLLGLGQLLRDLRCRASASLTISRIHPSREDRQHHQERDQLDDHGAIDRR